MRNALDGFEGSIAVGGRKATSLRYADDIVLIAGSLEELQNLVKIVKSESEKAGLFLDLKKTKVMKIQRTPTENGLEIDGCNVENVDRFTYLGATFTNTVEDSTEVKRRIGIAKNATVAVNTIWKNRGITLTTKIRLLNTMVFSIVSYGSECWV